MTNTKRLTNGHFSNARREWTSTRQIPLDTNIDPFGFERPHVPDYKEEAREFCVKMTLIVRDILQGNPKLAEMGWLEESRGRNGILGGFQGQRQWTDWLPNGDFTEAILNSSFDWNGKKEPVTLATENDASQRTFHALWQAAHRHSASLCGRSHLLEAPKP